MSTNYNPSDLISQAEAARLRGITRQAVHRLIERGRLTVIEMAGRRLLLRSEVLAFTPNAPGRPQSSDHD